MLASALLALSTALCDDISCGAVSFKDEFPRDVLFSIFDTESCKAKQYISAECFNVFQIVST